MVPMRYSTFDAGLLHDLLGHGDRPLLEEDEFLDGADQRDHDLGQDALALLLDLDGGLDDGADLHVADLGEDDRQAAAAEAHHRVELVEFLDPLLDLLGGDAEAARRPRPGPCRRAAGTRARGGSRRRMVTGKPSIASKMPTKSAFWKGSSSARAALRPGLVVGEDHLAHGEDAVVAEEHVLGPAEADPLGAELAGLLGVLGGVGVGADLEGPGGVGPAHELGEVAGDARGRRWAPGRPSRRPWCRRW